MNTSRHAPLDHVSDETSAFLDGDTLVVIFSSQPDFSHCANLILYTAKQAEAHNMQHLLLDCSALSVPLSPAFKHITDIGRFLGHRNTRVLMLDASDELRADVEPLLPGALWIDSCTGAVNDGRDQDVQVPALKRPFSRNK